MTRKSILLIILMQMSLITLMSMVVMMWVGWMNVAGLNMGHVLGPGSVKVRGLGSSLPKCPLCLPTSDNNVFHRLTAAKLFGQGQLSEPVEQNITKQSFSVRHIMAPKSHSMENMFQLPFLWSPWVGGVQGKEYIPNDRGCTMHMIKFKESENSFLQHVIRRPKSLNAVHAFVSLVVAHKWLIWNVLFGRQKTHC